MFELHHLSATEQWDWLQRGEVSPRELAAHYLERTERLNPELGAFVTVTAEAALRRADDVAALGRAAPLWGMPTADKDLSRRRGVPTGYGSRLSGGEPADASDEIVRVLDDAGAVSLGKTATPEFGLTAYTESLANGATRNPWNPELGAGGSSGGAAVAVAAGLLPFAIGSDGGGSVRIPAAANGLVGIKPSRGLVPSASGVDRLAGLVVSGPIARSVADAALLLDALRSGGRYPFAVRAPGGDGQLLASAVRGEGRYQLGVLAGSPWDEAYDIRLDPEITAAFEAAVREFDALGHGVEPVTLDSADYPELFTTLWQASAVAIPAHGDELERLEPITAWLVRAGRALSAERLVDALARTAAFERRVISRFAPFDAVLTPTLAELPPPIGAFDQQDALRNFAQQVRFAPFTSFVNVSGLPAITLPVSQSRSGMPIGVQLIGRPGGEAALLSLGAQLERRLRWQRRHPPGW